ncbi:mitochondrial outer membrane import complex protein METAXIN [Citrus sinensis]|uniref:Mitochondrial outer membrane import complex protein METAXIN n=1 Tax=Citrus sinensis TaxID=2711 RepID=A0ACB8P6V1_CITSI|nr:mitochondrial outer membrane import complex protein METAXIN [Citrus sinensis]
MSDIIPYVESGTYVACNNENGGVIECLKKDGIVDLDNGYQSVPEWISMKALISSWLEEALIYELWVGSDGNSVRKIYYPDLAWPIGKVLFLQQVRTVKQQLGITKENSDRREEEIYNRASIAYRALSTRLGEESFLFENRPSSVDAILLAHVLVTLHALPETSLLKSKLLEHGNLVRYAEKLKTEFVEAGSSSSIPPFPSDPSSSTPRKGSKPKPKPKREKTEEEKTFRRRAKYFLATQLVAIVLFLSVMNIYDISEPELDNEGDIDFD